MGRKLPVATKSNISKRKNQKKPKTEITKKRDRLKADLSRFKDRLLKAYTRTLPYMITKNIGRSQQQNDKQKIKISESHALSQQYIKEESMKIALKKFINYENSYSKRQEQFKLQDIDQLIWPYFWSFVFNLQQLSLKELFERPDHLLMEHHAPITDDDLEKYINKYLPQHTYGITCKDGVINFQNKDVRIGRNYSRIRKDGKKLYNSAIITIVFCILALCSSADNGQAEPQRRFLQTNQNPYLSRQNLAIPYGLNTTSIIKVDLSENQIKKVSQSAALLGIFTFLIIFLIFTCIMGVIYLKIALEERISWAIQFSLNGILGT